MSVAFGKYVFRMIKGRIIPIRAKVAERLVEPAIDKAITAIHGTDALGRTAKFKGIPKSQRLGRGVTFDVLGPFSTPQGHLVLKLPRDIKSQFKVAKGLERRYPGIENPAVRHVTLGRSLPNYGLPTIESNLVRIRNKEFGVVQEYTSKSLRDLLKTEPEKARKEFSYVEHNLKYLRQSQLNFDAHYGNLTQTGYLRDTALATPPKRREMWNSLSQELFEDIGRIQKRPEYVSRIAVSEAPSKKAVNEVNRLLKSGYRFKPIRRATAQGIKEDAEYNLLSPKERVWYAKAQGIKFVKRGNKLTIKRPKR